MDTSWIANISQGGPHEASVKIQADPKFASTVTDRLKPYKNMPAKFQPALEAVADYYRSAAIPRVFTSEGPGWRPLAMRTQQDRAAQGFGAKHPILIRTKDLYKELTEKSHPNHVEVIKTGANSRIIIGGKSEKFIRNQLGSSVFKIPPRPMLPGTGYVRLNQGDEQAMQRILSDSILRQMQNHD